MCHSLHTYLAVVGEAKVVKSEVIDHGENDVSRRGCGAPAWREKRERECRCHCQIIIVREIKYYKGGFSTLPRARAHEREAVVAEKGKCAGRKRKRKGGAS